MTVALVFVLTFSCVLRGEQRPTHIKRSGIDIIVNHPINFKNEKRNLNLYCVPHNYCIKPEENARMDSILNNSEVLLFLLGVVVKKNGGTLRIPESEIIATSGADMLTLAYDKKAKMVVLMTIDADLKDTGQAN